METQMNEVIELLVALGLPREKAPQIVSKINGIAFIRALDAHIEKFPETVRNQVKTLSQNQLEEFFKTNASTLPKLTEEDLRRASEETWREYFETLNTEVDK